MRRKRAKLVCGELPPSLLSGFREKVKLLSISDSTETLSLRIQLDYSRQTMKTDQNISAFSKRLPCYAEIYNNCIVAGETLTSSRPNAENESRRRYMTVSCQTMAA